MPSGEPYYGDAERYDNANLANDWKVTGITDFPWQGFPGQGIQHPSGPVKPITRRQVIGMAVYRPAAQLGEEYGNMETERGGTRGKFTELVFDMKHDAWVIPQYSHGILLIVDAEENSNKPAINVRIVPPVDEVEPTITAIKATPATVTLTVNQEANPQITVTGTGKFDKTWTAYSSAANIADVKPDGKITAKAVGNATITYRSTGDPTKTATVAVTVNAG